MVAEISHYYSTASRKACQSSLSILQFYSQTVPFPLTIYNKGPVSDEEAGSVIKEGAAGHRKKWTWRYKLHLIADAAYELSIAMMVTPGNTSEVAEMLPLLRYTKMRLPWFAPKYVIADKGYDDHKNFEAIVKEFDAEPIIKTSSLILQFYWLGQFLSREVFGLWRVLVC